MDNLDFIPERFGPVYGTAVHAAFAVELRAQNLPGIGSEGVEQSFNAGDISRYGIAGSIRTDAVLRNDVGDIIAIYDVKTGGSALRPSRAAELRAMTGAGNVPVIELHFERGPSLKNEQIEKDFQFDRAETAWDRFVRRYARRMSD